MSSMKPTRQAGAMNLLVIPLVLLFVALMGVGVFAYTSYAQAQDYKNNVDAKVEIAVAEAAEKIADQKEKEFAEKEKYPYDTYVAPEAAGSLKVQYPKNWSAYVVAPTGRTTSKPVDGYFYPGQVPSISEANNSFALRILVAQQSYDSLLKKFQSAQKAGKVTIEPYQSPNVPSLIGAKVTGEVESKKQGMMVMLPFRDKTLQMWSESAEYNSDFENVILKNFTLTP